MHWAAANGHLECVSFLISFDTSSLWALDNGRRSAQQLAQANHCETVVQYLDYIVAQQSALNTKMVRKMKQQAGEQVDKRLKALHKSSSHHKSSRHHRSASKFQHRSTDELDEPEDIDDDGGRGGGGPFLASQLNHNIIYSDVNHNDCHEHSDHAGASLASKHGQPSSCSWRVSTPTFSELVHANGRRGSKSGGSSHGGTMNNLLSRMSKKMMLSRKGNKYSRQSDGDGDGHRKYGSTSTIDATSSTPLQSSSSPPPLNGRASLKDVFSRAMQASTSQRTTTGSTFNKNTRKPSSSTANKSTCSASCSLNRSLPSLYRTVSEPDFMQHHHNSPVGQLSSDSLVANHEGSRAQTSSSIFDRPGFGSVAFRGKLTPELLFSKRFLSKKPTAFPTGASRNPQPMESVSSRQGRQNGAEDSGHEDNDDDECAQDNRSGSSTTAESGHHFHDGSSSHASTNHYAYSTSSSSSSSDSIGSADSLAPPPMRAPLPPPPPSSGHRCGFRPSADVQYDEDDDDDDDAYSSSSTIPVLLFLYAHHLAHLYEVFELNKIDIDTLMAMEQQDLLALGVPIADSGKLMHSIGERRRAIYSSSSTSSSSFHQANQLHEDCSSVVANNDEDSCPPPARPPTSNAKTRINSATFETRL